MQVNKGRWSGRRGGGEKGNKEEEEEGEDYRWRGGRAGD